MRYKVLTTVLALIVATPAMGDENGGHSGGDPGKHGSDGSQRMNEAMDAMGQTMRAIQDTDDPQERRALMEAYMQRMPSMHGQSAEDGMGMDGHGNGDRHKGKGQRHGSGGMIQGDIVQGMSEHMQSMRETMRRIQATDDPDKRRVLMGNHHKAMRAQVREMKTLHEGHGGKQNRNIEHRMERMEEHMRMMQGMMEQVMMRHEVSE